MQTTPSWRCLFRNSIKMEIREVMTCPGIAVPSTRCWCQQQDIYNTGAAHATLPNDRRNTNKDIVSSSSDNDNE